MNTSGLRVLSKRLIDPSMARADPIANELDLRSGSDVYFSSEHPDHPVDHLFDGSSGQGASCWVAGRSGRSETLLLIFNDPVNICHCGLEAEELEVARTQQVTAEYLPSGADTYRQCFIHQFNFTRGAGYQRELIDVDLRSVRRLRFTILADKSGRGTPRLTALRLFSSRW